MPRLQIVPGNERDFTPPVPVNAVFRPEYGIEPVLMEGHSAPGVQQQLGQLIALIRQHPIWRSILTLGQHVVKLTMQG
ncbi:hypothetical protein [Paraburkholderia adhaesiva]|uniref:hypothetical protein n=1 Tax=Paraburkholderia adhaesiva TaxID=2883244 RepID=UPI001F380C12|nr:hypothetical protein [Paraburkholderia adhaesiva]